MVMFNTVLFFLYIFINACNGRSDQELNVLMTTGITGWSFLGYKTCMNAVKFVMENQSSDYLPGYKINLIAKDEGPNSFYSPGQLTKFWRGDFNGNGSLAPVVIGPISSMGCKPFAKVAKATKMYGFVRGCNSPEFSVKKETYSNIVRIGIPGENLASSIVKFIQASGWKHIAIFSTTSDLDYDGSQLVYQAAPKVNISVGWFEALHSEGLNSENGFKTLSRLKASQNRIIVLGISRWFDIFEFYCMAHKVGISGSNYVFVVVSFAHTDIDQFPDVVIGKYCDREILKAQQSITFFVGGKMSNMMDFGDEHSSLGHSRKSLDHQLDKYLAMSNGSVRNELDYRHRFSCYDIAMVALLALNRTETTLKQSNLTLSDWHEQPDLIASAIGNAIKGMKFDGLNTKQQMFSDRIELDSQHVFVVSKRQGQLKLHYEVTPGVDVFDPNSYVWEEIAPIEWENNEKPIDLDLIVYEMRQTPIGFTYAIVAISALLTLSQLVVIGLVMVKKQNGKTRKLATQIACIGLNCASIAFGFGTVNDGDIGTNLVLCKFRIILVVFSLTLLHGLSLVQLRRLGKRASLLKMRSRTFSGVYQREMTTTKSGINGKEERPKSKVPTVPSRKLMIKPKKKRTELKLVLLIISIISIYLLIWLTSDPLSFTVVQEAPIVDEIADMTLIRTEGVCNSARFEISMAILGSGHDFSLLVGIFLSLQLRRVANDPQFEMDNPNFKNIRILHLNYLAIFIISILLLFIFPTFSTQSIILTCVSLLYSLVTFIFIGWKC